MFKITQILFISLLFTACSGPPDDKPNASCGIAVHFENLVGSEVEKALMECGGLDSLDLMVIRSQALKDIVNVKDFQAKKYTIDRLVQDYIKFHNTPEAKKLLVATYIETKVFSEKDWTEDSKLVKKYYHLNSDELQVFKKVAITGLNYNEIMKLFKEHQIEKHIKTEFNKPH